MNKRLNIMGQKFGKLTVIEFSHVDKSRKTYWKCVCDCGNETIVLGSNLKSEKIKSCGTNFYYKEKNYMICQTHRGEKFIFDIVDYNNTKQYTWTKRGNYFFTWINGKTIDFHRFILNPKTNEEVDHINHNTFDNRRNNLRICTPQQNQFNRICGYGSSKFKGVSWNKQRRKWQATIRINKKHINLGCFENELDAAKAYNNAAIKHFGEFAWLNDLQVAL